MLLSNKHVHRFLSTTILVSFFSLPVFACIEDKKTEEIKTEATATNFNLPGAIVPVVEKVKEISSSHSQRNIVAEEEIVSIFSQPIIIGEEEIVSIFNTEKESVVEEKKTVKKEKTKKKKEKIKTELASNGKPYVIYEVYDAFYGSDKWHMLDAELQKYTYELCIEYGIEKYFTLILCQLYYESQYDEDAVSQTSDYGMAQINRTNHKWLSKELGITNFLDAKQSILCNIYMMSSNLKKYSVESSLFCYNTGKRNGSNRYSRNIIYLWNNCVRQVEE